MNKYVIIRHDELYHHGIKDMLWGHRNGPPYPLDSKGKARFKAMKDAHEYVKEEKAKRERRDRRGYQNPKGASSSETAKKAFDQSIKTKNGKISPAEKIGKEATNVGRSASKLSNQIGNIIDSKQRAQTKKEASQMSDQELMRRINRMQLEQRYEQLSQPQVSKGRERVKQALDVTLTALEIGASAAAIAGTIYAIKRG